MRVMIAEDDVVSRRILESTLVKWGYEVVTAGDGAEAWALLQRTDAPKLVILDWMMPALDGVEICRRVRAQTAEPYTYIILLTAKGNRDDLITALDAGADDFVAKPFNPLELKGRLRAGERVLELQDALLAAREEMHYLATHDFLTGLWNRLAILEQLHRALARAGREGSSFALALADVDDFKSINDTYGHGVGDEVLREIARRMTACVRPYDVVGRYGGEEFLILFEGCSPADAVGLAERLRSSVADEGIQVGKATVRTSVSLGVATPVRGRIIDADTLIRSADMALYEAKKVGRNRVVAAGHSQTPDQRTLYDLIPPAAVDSNAAQQDRRE